MEQQGIGLPRHTGGSGVLENIFKKLLHCATMNDQAIIPRTFKRGGDIREHVRKVSDYMKSVELNEQGKCAF